MAPEVNTTAGGVAKHAVEEYAKMLDRQDVEVHVVMPFVRWHTQTDYQNERKKIEDHPFLEEKDLKIEYTLDDLEKLRTHFKGITEILQRYDYLTERQLRAWKNITNDLNYTYNHWASGLEHAREQEEWERQQELWDNIIPNYYWENLEFYEEERVEGGWQTNASVDIAVPEKDITFKVVLYTSNGQKDGDIVTYTNYGFISHNNKLTEVEYKNIIEDFIQNHSSSAIQQYLENQNQ